MTAATIPVQSARPVVDVRVKALRRFAFAISTLTLFGQTLLGFEPGWIHVFASLATLPLRAAREALLERFDSFYLTRLLHETGGNATEAARRAGIDRVTIFRHLRRYGLSRD